MEINNNKRDIIGMILFALSIITLGYMFLTPLNHVIIHIDEYFSMSLTTLPIWDIINITSWDVHPPLYYILGKVAVKLAQAIGMDYLLSLRILSIIPYIIILAISATKIRKDYGWLTAGLFTISLGVMSEFFTHFLIARMYGWAILFTLIAFLAFVEIIKNKDIKAWIVLAVFSALCAYTHYFAAITAACIYIILLAYILKFEKDEIKMWAMSAAGAVIIYIPWIPSLIRQLTAVHGSYWIPPVDLNMFVNALGYYAYTSDVLISAVSVIILAAILFIYFRQNSDLGEKEHFLILSGVGVYFATILLSIIISVVFKPILMVRYLLPATAVMWLAISIIIAKIKDKKMFAIAMALIALLLVTGFSTTITANDTIYQNGLSQKEVLDNISQDPNSMLIITHQNMIMYFLDYANESDTYFLNVGHVFGENMDRLHQFYNFKTYNGTQIDSLIANNTGKNIYIISWGKPVLNSTVSELDQEIGIVFSKVTAPANTTAADSSEEEYY